MLAADRHRIILEMLEEHGSVRTVDLAQRLNVTDETVRRDLDKLEKEARLCRTHGGAVKERLQERPFAERNIEHISEKQAIARLALREISEGDTLFIDASSTALQLVYLLGDFPIRVITHSFFVAVALQSKPLVELTLAGGTLDRTSYSFVGSETLLALRRHRVDRAFCSGNGLNMPLGMSEINEQQALIKEVIAERSQQFICLADSSKMGMDSRFYFADPSGISLVITDAPEADPVILALRGMGVDSRHVTAKGAE